MNSKQLIIVLTTVPTKDKASELGSELVKARLAACVNIIPAIESIYHWKGNIQKDNEVLLLIKTTKDLFSALKEKILGLHPYEVPEIISVDVSDVFDKYGDWVVKLRP